MNADRLLIVNSFVFGIVVGCSVATAQEVPIAEQRPASSIRVPKGEAESVVLVWKEFDGRPVAARTGIVFHSDQTHSYIAVDSADQNRWQPFDSDARNLSFHASVGFDGKLRRVALRRFATLKGGQRLIYAGPKDELPPPLRSNSPVAVEQGTKLLLVGCCTTVAEGFTKFESAAIPVTVDAVESDPTTHESVVAVRSEKPEILRSGLLITPAGQAVGTASPDPKTPRATSGYRRFVSESISGLRRKFGPEVADIRANIRVFDGKAFVDFLVQLRDPFSQWQAPQLLISTASTGNLISNRLANGSAVNGRNASVLIGQGTETTITVADGTWTDKPADGREVDLVREKVVDWSFMPIPSVSAEPAVSSWSGRLSLDVAKKTPISFRFSAIGSDGKRQAFGPVECAIVDEKTDNFGSGLMRGNPAYASPPGWVEPKQPSAPSGRALTSRYTSLEFVTQEPGVVQDDKPTDVNEPLLADFRENKHFASATIGLKIPPETGNNALAPVRIPMAASADGRWLYIVDVWNVLHQIDTGTWTEAKRLPLNETVADLAISSGGLVVALRRGELRIFDAGTLAMKQALPAVDQQGIVGTAGSPWVFVAMPDRLLILDAAAGRYVHDIPQVIFKLTRSRVDWSKTRVSMALTSDARYLFVYDGAINRFRIEDKQLYYEESSADLVADGTDGICIGDDGRFVAVPSAENGRDPNTELPVLHGLKLTEPALVLATGPAPKGFAVRTTTNDLFATDGKRILLFDSTGTLKQAEELSQDGRRLMLLPKTEQLVFKGLKWVVVDPQIERLRAAMKK